MKKLLVVPVLASILAACSSAPKETFDRRSHQINQQRQANAERAVEQAPPWMFQLPRSNSAVYENGTATSSDMGMATNKAKTMAFGKICMAAGGRVDQQSRMFIADNQDSSTEISELAIKSFCPGVDLTGVEMVETKLIAEGGRFRSYVLMALPTGDANLLRRANEARDLRSNAQRRQPEAFREMEKTRADTPQ